MKNTITVFCDGGSRGNPGQAAYGFVIKNDSNDIIYKEGKTLGIQTNNFAEYMAVITALSYLLKNTESSVSKIHFYLDSLLVVNQINGHYKVKSETIRELFITVKNLIRKFSLPITFEQIPREKNREADKMVNIALDAMA